MAEQADMPGDAIFPYVPAMVQPLLEDAPHEQYGTQHLVKVERETPMAVPMSEPAVKTPRTHLARNNPLIEAAMAGDVEALKNALESNVEMSVNKVSKPSGMTGELVFRCAILTGRVSFAHALLC
jgi:hypothetical protein